MKKGEMIYSKLKEEFETGFEGGLLDYTITEMSYHSNKIEGSTLTREQTQSLYEHDYISTSDPEENLIKGDDVVEMKNHFRLIREVIKHCDKKISQDMIKEYHSILKGGTKDVDRGWAVGEYKQLRNKVGNIVTARPENVEAEMTELIDKYQQKTIRDDLDAIIEFHVEFERIHPFQDGNGRVGRAIMLKETLKNKIVPFIIHDSNKLFYYNGLAVYDSDPNVITNVCLNAQKEYQDISEEFIARG